MLKREKVEEVTKQLNLANESVASLESMNVTLQENFKYLDESHEALKV